MPNSPWRGCKNRWIYSIFLSGVAVLLLFAGCTLQAVSTTQNLTATSTPSPSNTPTAKTPATLTLSPEPTSTIVVRGLYSDIPTITSNSFSQEQIAERLITIWLEQFTNENVGSSQRLVGFEIIETEINPDVQKCAKDYGAEYIATVTFSVQPVGTPSDWYAGGGTVSDDFKSITRQDEIAVLKNGELYTWKPLGIPICPPS